jgi:hypothetical protein
VKSPEKRLIGITLHRIADREAPSERIPDAVDLPPHPIDEVYVGRCSEPASGSGQHLLHVLGQVLPQGSLERRSGHIINARMVGSFIETEGET